MTYLAQSRGFTYKNKLSFNLCSSRQFSYKTTPIKTFFIQFP